MARLACVVLAAGQGVRMKSKLPKPLHTLCGRPMIDQVLTTVAYLEPERTVVVVVRPSRVIDNEPTAGMFRLTSLLPLLD